ncbi:MAG: DNA polymerase III subunit delta' [Campylobacteraceae bacterium]|nr:DNA polymerase III subunit delta' [Campylobacteraceae bacterium]
MPLSYIALVSDLDFFAKKLETDYPNGKAKLFFKEDFLVEDAKAAIKEAYIAESTPKIIALGAKSYNIYAQNTLLKIVEEPPKNIVFILASLSKTAFLPTVRSRLQIKDFRETLTKEPSGLNFYKLDLEDIYRFIEARKHMSRQELKALVQTLSFEALEAGVKVATKDLELFATLVRLADLNSKSHYILLTQLLALYERIHE